MGTRVCFYYLCRFVMRECRLVDSLGPQRVVDIGNGDDARGKGNVFTVQARWVTAAIKLLVM